MRLTIDGPVSISIHVLPKGDHSEVLDIHRVIFVRRGKDRCFGLVSLLFLPLVLDFPGEVDGVFDLGEVKLPVDKLSHEDDLLGRKH